MTFFVMYPAVAALSLFVLMVIILMLKFGAQWCKLRHNSLNDHKYCKDEVLAQSDSYT